MKKKITATFFVLLCAIAIFFRYDIINQYLSYNYPSPIDLNGIKIPIEKGFVYSKQSNKGIRISDPFLKRYSIQIKTEFVIPPDRSLEQFVDGIGYMIVKSEISDYNNSYIRILAVNRQWLFSIFTYIPKQKILLEYTGTEKYYINCEKILNTILDET